MEFKVMDITPAMAKDWLENCNANNRAKKRNAIERYARDMKNGNWELSSSAISFGCSGELLDGQNRLYAIVESGVTVKMVVATNVTSGVFDMNVRRTPADLYKMEDGGNINFTMSAMVRGKLMIIDGVKYPTEIDIIDEYKESKELYDLAYEICVKNKGANKRITKKGGICLACFTAIKAGCRNEMIESFFNTLATGFPDDRVDSSPAIALRNYLIQLPRKSGDSAVKEQFEMCCYSILCFMNQERKLIIRKPKNNRLMQIAFGNTHESHED